MITAETTEIAGLTNALDALVVAALAHRDSKPKTTTFTRITATELMARPMPSKTDQLIADPIGHALEIAVVMIGKRLNAIGGRKAMDMAFDAIEDAHPNSTREAVYIDHRWDGIGGVWFC